MAACAVVQGFGKPEHVLPLLRPMTTHLMLALATDILGIPTGSGSARTVVFAVGHSGRQAVAAPVWFSLSATVADRQWQRPDCGRHACRPVWPTSSAWLSSRCCGKRHICHVCSNEHLHARPGSLETHMRTNKAYIRVLPTNCYFSLSVKFTNKDRASNVRRSGGPGGCWHLLPEPHQFSPRERPMHIATNKDVKRSGLYPHVTRHTSSHCKHTAAHHRCITVSPLTTLGHVGLHTAHNDARRSQACCDTSR